MVLLQCIVLTKRIFFAAFLLFSLRVLFYLLNPGYFQEVYPLEALWPLLYGLRFDLATACIFNSVLILFSFVTIQNKLYSKFLLLLYLLGSSLACLLNIVDIEYFKFNGKRLSKDLFDISSDIADQALQLILYYWYVPLLFVLCLGLLLWCFNVTEKKAAFVRSNRYFPLHTCLYLCFAFIAVRGGLQMRSISVKSAFIFSKHEMGHLSLNSAYTLVRSLEQKEVARVNLFLTDSEAESYLLEKRHFRQTNLQYSNHNIIILVIESLSQEYMDEGFTPFLNKLAKQGLYFDRNYANGRRSIEALPSILTGIPSLLDRPISQSSFQSNNFLSLPRELKKKGYQTSFFHGGKTGTMDFDAYTQSIGIDNYYGKEDYPNPKHYDGYWGIFDHYFYEFFLEKLSQTKSPFFSTFFSLSSHQPYTIPKDFKGKFSKGTLEIHESIQYADEALRLFFEKAQKKDWYKKTLFIITADHTQKLQSQKYLNRGGRYRVPLIFFYPKSKLTSVKKVTQHADIMPSIFDFLDLKTQKQTFIGSSVFNDDSGVAITGNGTSFLFVSGAKELIIDKKAQSFDPSLDDNKYFYALYQYIINGLRMNKL